MKRAYGFTIVELLIAIVVIAILAALSYVGYVNIANRANDAAVQSDLRSLLGLVQSHEVVHSSYPSLGSSSPSMPGGIKLAVNKQAYSDANNLYYCVIPSGENARFSVAGRSRSGNIFAYYNGSFQPYSGAFNTGNVICSNMGIPSAEAGYEYHYGRDASNNWAAWTNG